MGNGGLKGNFELTAHPTPVTFRFWPNKLSLFFGALPLSGEAGFPLFQQVFFIENVIVGYVGSTIAVLISIIISAFFIPNMLRKGSIDMLLVKPISRFALLLYKFVGGLTFIFLNTVVAVVGIWAALGFRSGIWGVAFLETILVLTFFFAILYSVSTLFGVLTRSPIAAILLTVGVWFVFFIVGVVHEVFQGLRAWTGRPRPSRRSWATIRSARWRRPGGAHGARVRAGRPGRVPASRTCASTRTGSAEPSTSCTPSCRGRTTCTS